MKARITIDDIRGPASDPDRYRRQLREQLGVKPVAVGGRMGQRKQDDAHALVAENRPAGMLADPGGTLFVRIVRVGGRHVDGDNLSRGYKALRDAIASAFGRKSDSEADGWVWEYDQEPGTEVGTRIEVTGGK